MILQASQSVKQEASSQESQLQMIPPASSWSCARSLAGLSEDAVQLAAFILAQQQANLLADACRKAPRKSLMTRMERAGSAQYLVTCFAFLYGSQLCRKHVASISLKTLRQWVLR